MRRLTVFGLIVMVGTTALAADAPRSLAFSKDDLGKVPAGWKSDKTGKGDGSVWKVVADDSGPGKTGYALAQSAASPKAMFNLCVAENVSAKDVEVRVAFKAVKGKLDQGGGIVWRYQDNNNYYVARMNPLEDNFRFYKVVDGKRIQLAGKEEIKVPADDWHRLAIKQSGNHVEGWLDGKKLIEATDDSFTKTGKVGLWSKADAQTHFDDFTVLDLGK